ncbi:MAG: hypothetical protein CMJ78_12685, partial [Planctomycetaceae bacterium]|nr:hypothetical protein [Planctomycetaceae bacterium]
MLVTLILASHTTADAAKKTKAFKSEARTATAVDRVINAEILAAEGKLAPKTSDEDFLRRVTFDIAGTVPTPSQVTLFALDPDEKKRTKLIDRLLESDAYATNWARYWRDVIFSKATNARVRGVQGTFETWMTEQLKENAAWDEIATGLITATGDIRYDGETALIFAQEGQPSEIAAEVSRIFLGIQMQCANCHDHPTDSWNREQFHQLAAFFPRVGVRPVREENNVRSFEIVSVNQDSRNRRPFAQNPERVFNFLDRNRDGKINKAEASRNQNFARLFERIIEFGDKNKDGALTLEELRAAADEFARRVDRKSRDRGRVRREAVNLLACAARRAVRPQRPSEEDTLEARARGYIGRKTRVSLFEGGRRRGAARR